MKQEPKNPVQAVQTNLRLVQTLNRLGSAGVSELAEKTGMNLSTIHNHLATLAAEDYVVKTDENEYRLSLKFLEHGGRLRKSRALYREGRQELTALAEETGELANLMIEERGLGIHLYSARGESAMEFESFVGDRQRLHHTGVGKAILAHMDRDRIDEIIAERGLPQRTDNTITDREALDARLEEIRERGYAVDDEEKVTGLRCVAAPVIANENLMGAVSVSGPASRVKNEVFREELPDKVVSTADLIGIKITHA
jgi:DNA-binding IclR family transcriptional regulator